MKWKTHFKCVNSKCIKYGSIDNDKFPSDSDNNLWKSGHVNPLTNYWTDKVSLQTS